ncbi:hypothetical protein [Dyadobacter arcticus]|uniref:Uncharacterized protein n=1 Tax=Dyadobacter arcticus TaxID=1078754 RepID=A0ABX0USB1_9BACT|nr:hypothetical protein [Dyadobacter arcticus]NIJ55863.1 hypothetical protein [Dyadobacter arcticus]
MIPIRGLIRDEGWTKSPESIEFKVKNGPLQTFSADDTKGFGILSTNEIYKSKRIALLNITSSQVYITAPSLEARDSAQVFLQEIVTGNKAILFEFLNLSEQPHYFIEKDKLLKELYNYSFYKSIDDRTYLLVYDDYKKQLAQFCGDNEGFKAPIPPYQRKQLKQYIENYNNLSPEERKIYKPKNNRLTFDFDLNASFENWNQPPFVIENKFTYGIWN